MKNKILKSLLFCFALSLTGSIANAEIKLPKMFTDNMVLQQKTEAPIWGKATPEKEVKITTSWDNQTYKVKAGKDGKWLVKVNTPQAGGPYSIAISDGKTLTLNNILIGEVWICSGQSNMEMPLAGWGKINDYEKEIAEAKYPDIRLLHVNKAASTRPLDDLTATRNGWQECSPANIAEFSATAYFFGRDLYKNLNVPIGLISTSWGGTVAEAWTSGESLEYIPDFKQALDNMKNQPEEIKTENPNRVTVLYNAMIHPLVPLAFQGAIWYQGESNADRAAQYKELFPLMIRDWRKAWNRDFPFYFVQLANFKDQQPEPVNSNWAELREAQLQTLHLDNTGMAVIIDIGDAKDIHPKNKQDVGIRLALNARALTYKKKTPYSGPVYKSYKIQGDEIRIHFSHADGLKTSDGSEVKGFAIAGSDHVFHWANAVIEGNKVIVGSPEVKFPVAVRYAWADNPVCNLYNGAGLPASPFRTDNW
ncbi:MAG: sialate O-acetylesterase [Dysgonamonadaceae bacterium]|jgi:sialate O-acetylesterase|nr:sialate O-acetylesterase [Dysgonamonadaceae bacterium]